MKMSRRRFRRVVGEPAAFDPEPALEPVYRHIFTRQLAQMETGLGFLPTSPVVNYGMLHLILRIATELQPHNVLEIGAGQTTLLWDLLVRSGRVARVTTIESDAEHAAEIGLHMAHPPIVVPLRLSRIGSVLTHTYDWEMVQGGPFDVIVCAGPASVPRYSRYGVLALLDRHLPDDFVLVLNDAQRSGEQDSIAAIHDRLTDLGRPYRSSIMRATQTQAIFATGRYAQLCEGETDYAALPASTAR